MTREERMAAILERIDEIGTEMENHPILMTLSSKMRAAAEREIASLQRQIEQIQQEILEEAEAEKAQRKQAELQQAREQAKKSRQEAEAYKKDLDREKAANQVAEARRAREAQEAAREAETQRRETERLKQQRKLAHQQKLAEEARLERERLTEEANRLKRERIAAEKREHKRMEHEREKEEQKAAKKAERERIAAEKEAARKAELDRVTTEREAARLAEQQRLQAEQAKKAEEARAAEEQRRLEEARLAEAATIIPDEFGDTPPVPTEPYPTTGPALKAWRMEKGFNDAQAADYLGVSRGTIYNSEKSTGPLGPKLLDIFRRKHGLSTITEETSDTSAEEKPEFQILLGATQPSPQYGILGEAAGKRVAIDLNNNHVISLFGVQGGGKSYNLGNLVELATTPIPRLNCLPQPFATIIFHYSATLDYAPEFTSMAEPNNNVEQLKLLKERYGAEPRALSDLVLLVPAEKLQERQAEYPNLDVRPLKFASSELKIAHWQFLMGTLENSSVYIQQVTRLMRQQRTGLTLGRYSSLSPGKIPQRTGLSTTRSCLGFC